MERISLPEDDGGPESWRIYYHINRSSHSLMVSVSVLRMLS